MNGELWNQAEVMDYLRKVYRADSIISYEREDVKPEKDFIRAVLDRLKNSAKNRSNYPDESAFQEAEEELQRFCKA